jgi:hypothetical protein
MQFDPNAGVVASQDLLRLATGWYNSVYNDGSLVPGPWNGWYTPGNSGAGPGGIPGGTNTNPFPWENGPLFWQAGEGTMGDTSLATLPAPEKIYFISQDKYKVLVAARTTLPQHLTQFEADLTALGMQITLVTPGSNMVTGWFPILHIMDLNSVANFSAVTPIPRPIHNVGSVTSEGDSVIKADVFRAQEGVDGTGIKVGVLSDSVNEFTDGPLAGAGAGLTGLAASVATGDLPANVQVIQDSPYYYSATDEGRAMLEIIHDVAPGAALAFATGDAGGAAGFAANILALNAAGCNVITDDLTYLDSPMFSPGRVGQAVEKVFNNGAVYTTAAGNFGDEG